jgi:NADPH2:quinone reductase
VTVRARFTRKSLRPRERTLTVPVTPALKRPTRSLTPPGAAAERRQHRRRARFLSAAAQVYTHVSIPKTMRALQQPSLRGPQDMHLIADAPVPTPRAGEVLIRVGAAGVNFADISRAHGTFRDGPQPPYVAGFEAAGEVVGARRGTVVGVGYGAFAEYMVLPGAAAMPVPPGWSAEQALGLAVNWPTALAALRPLGRLRAGETVLIHAAAGATGQAAVTLAKHFGATVIATASPAKHATVRALGADHVLDSRGEHLADEVLALTGGADLVLESAGGSTFAASLAAARRVSGRVVVYGLAGGEASISNWELVYKHQVQLIGLNIGVLMQTAPELIVGELSALIAAGVLGPARPTVYDLADGPRALAELATRATTGKLALRP